MAFTEQKSKLARNLKTLMIHMNDSVKGYETALEKVPEDSEAASILQEQRSGRQDDVVLLKDRLAVIGESEKERASAEGAAHRALIDIKSWLTGKNETQVILNECIRGEEKLIQYIDDTFENVENAADIDGGAADVIDRLKHHIQASIGALKAVKQED